MFFERPVEFGLDPVRHLRNGPLAVLQERLALLADVREVECKKFFDAAEYLDTDELQTLYLDEAAKENDPIALIKAIDTVARAKGMAKTAKEAGISKEVLY